MDLMGCLGCEGTYEVGLPRCPHCGTRSPMFVGGENEMPKATTGGASNAWLENEPGYQPPVEAAPVEAAEVPADAEVTAAEPTPVETGDGDGSPAEAAAPVLPPVALMSKAELQDHADSLGLPISGSKADLAARIVEHHEAVAADAPPEPAAAEPEA